MAELFELVEEALDEIALLVEGFVILTLVFPAAAWRDDRNCLFLYNDLNDMACIIALVGDDMGGLERMDQIVRSGDVVLLPWAANQAYRQPQSVTRGMDLGG